MQKGTFPDLDALLNSLSEAVLMIKKNTRVADANKTAEEFFTTSSRKIVGKKLGELFPGMETLKHLVKKAVKELRSFSARDLAIRSLGDARAGAGAQPARSMRPNLHMWWNQLPKRAGDADSRGVRWRTGVPRDIFA